MCRVSELKFTIATAVMDDHGNLSPHAPRLRHARSSLHAAANVERERRCCPFKDMPLGGSPATARAAPPLLPSFIQQQPIALLLFHSSHLLRFLLSGKPHTTKSSHINPAQSILEVGFVRPCYREGFGGDNNNNNSTANWLTRSGSN